MVVIPFDVTIPNSERDNDLLEKLREEKSGILNLLIQGCLDWQRQDLVMTELVKKATDQYRANMDSVFGFIGSKCKSDPDIEMSEISTLSISGPPGGVQADATANNSSDTSVSRRSFKMPSLYTASAL